MSLLLLFIKPFYCRHPFRPILMQSWLNASNPICIVVFLILFPDLALSSLNTFVYDVFIYCVEYLPRRPSNSLQKSKFALKFVHFNKSWGRISNAVLKFWSKHGQQQIWAMILLNCDGAQTLWYWGAIGWQCDYNTTEIIQG